MEILTNLVARILFSIPFFVSGTMHLAKADMMKGAVQNLPGGIFWIYLTGVAMIAAGVSFVTLIQARTAGLLLAALLLVFILMIHVPGLGNEQMAQQSMIGLLKDIGLMGGSLLMAGLSGRKQVRTATA